MSFVRNKKGSALVLTVIVFGVLFILGTFTLSFMVTENKQAMYYQNKTQAYYYAKSGADVVESALVAELSKYSDDADKQKDFLDIYNNEQVINTDLDGVTVSVKNVPNKNGDRLLTVQSVAEYRGVKQTVKKVIFSSITEIASETDRITISNAPLMYVETAKQYTGPHKTEADIPPQFASKVDENSFKPHVFDIISETQWNSGSSLVNAQGELTSTTIGTTGTTTNIFVNGSLKLKGSLSFNGTVNVYVKNQLSIDQYTVINCETTTSNGIEDYYLNIYVYNENNADMALITPEKLHLTFNGNLYIKQGEVNLDLHQDAYIHGNIIYNGDKFNIGTQSNNIANMKKILDGSIYAPASDIYIGFENDKTAFILDGIILGKNLKVSAKNNTQVNKFYGAFVLGNVISVPVKTGETMTTRTVGYHSYYID